MAVMLARAENQCTGASWQHPSLPSRQPHPTHQGQARKHPRWSRLLALRKEYLRLRKQRSIRLLVSMRKGCRVRHCRKALHHLFRVSPAGWDASNLL